MGGVASCRLPVEKRRLLEDVAGSLRHPVSAMPGLPQTHAQGVLEPIRVARWFVFKPKIPVWVNFGGPLNGKCWHSLWPFGIVCGHM
jgi:hypothetical protein